MLTQKLFNIAQNGAEAILWLLILVSITSLAIMIERYISLRSIRSASQKFKKKIQESLQYDKLDELEKLRHDRDSLEGRALDFSLRHLKGNQDKGFEEVFNSFVVMERPSLERGLSFLATVGSNAPFVGLLGTVLGIMKAFKDLGVAQGVSIGNNASMVMNGIAEALVATAVGLFVAIPAVIAFNFFQRQVKSVLYNLESVRELAVAYSKQDPKKG
ncbi:MAG: MotA/TolQ/ExbB proton channel family protein [Bdellovibrionales bacterium]|nr:MotA/TolQ/ExbB proton channel family protein [Bdellovibrionales bacterium]